jgi:hypothetical protein
MMTPAQLAAEVKRCTRKNGSVGLASLCSICHREAGRKGKLRSPARRIKAVKRNKKLDTAAKLARGRCECGAEQCHRPVTAKNVGLFEWDHLVQSFDDRDYHLVSSLVNSGKSTKRCDKERAKCRLLYIKCHRAHSGKQIREASGCLA